VFVYYVWGVVVVGSLWGLVYYSIAPLSCLLYYVINIGCWCCCYYFCVLRHVLHDRFSVGFVLVRLYLFLFYFIV